MKRKLWINLSVGVVFFLVFSVGGVQTGEAVEAHHKKAPSSQQTDASPSGMMSKPSTGGGPGTMGGPGMMGGMGMMGDGDGPGMMGQGMMDMMMSHMMGGPGGMGMMMGNMGPGMKGQGGGPKGMKRMAHMLENLDLTADQWDKVRELAKKRLGKMADLWAQRMKLRIDMAGLRWDKDLDPEKVKGVFVKKAEVKAEMFLSCMSYLRDLKKILNEDQIKKLSVQGF